MDYQFKVETKEAGQRRAYGDSYYHYIVTDNSPKKHHESVVQNFCTGFVKPAISEKMRKERMEKEGFGAATFASYWTTFRKIGDNTFEYKVTQPSTH
ncbi:hypothetical protein [Mangrovibacterium sp.]|uniref:hypothetical protein n=1 Tax=Mangrovibacterium sp. TaxID=1961364 RepID=UPI003563D403